MKKIFKYFLFTALAILVTVACRDDKAVRIPNFISGVNARVVLNPSKSFINFADLTNASVAFDIYSVNTNLDEIVYTATYTDADSATAVFPTVPAITVPASAFVNGKATQVEVTATQLAQALGLPGGINYFSGGDQIVFKAEAKLKDGRIVDATNSAVSITGGSNESFTPQFTIYVGCPSPVAAITGKTYTATIKTKDSSGAPPFGGPDSGTKKGVTITFVGPEPFRYHVSSHDAGWWLNPDVAATEGGGADFFDICGTIIMQPKASFGFGGAVDFGGGSYDPATGIIKMNWRNSFNDINGFVTYTPEN